MNSNEISDQKTSSLASTMAQMTATPDLAATMQARADVVSQTQEKLATAEQIASVNATKEARLRSYFSEDLRASGQNYPGHSE